ncbi:MAG: hypothetical protein AB1349_12060 [Elusimicrobiota bacterium]
MLVIFADQISKISGLELMGLEEVVKSEAYQKLKWKAKAGLSFVDVIQGKSPVFKVAATDFKLANLEAKKGLGSALGGPGKIKEQLHNLAKDLDVDIVFVVEQHVELRGKGMAMLGPSKFTPVYTIMTVNAFGKEKNRVVWSGQVKEEFSSGEAVKAKYSDFKFRSYGTFTETSYTVSVDMEESYRSALAPYIVVCDLFRAKMANDRDKKQTEF